MHRGWYDRRTRLVRDLPAGDTRVYLELEVRRVDRRQCGTVKRERLEFLADNPFYTKRFAYYVGRRCRGSTIKDVAEELALDWHTVKELEKQYMRAPLARAGTPGPRRIGIDEISLGKRNTFRIVVSDLERQRPIWFGGQDRSEASMSLFYAWLGEKKGRRIKLALMDMWKPFRNATQAHAPQAAILFDKFHIMRHLGKALDEVRKAEYARLSGNDRRFIEGQKYTLLSNRELVATRRLGAGGARPRRSRPPIDIEALRVLMWVDPGSIDPDQIERVFINLMRNAGEAPGERGGVRVRWRGNGSAVVVEVEDDGPGLARTDNLWAPFFTTKPHGTGIRMVLSREIVENHGGSIALENRVGAKGCVARVRLPLG